MGSTVDMTRPVVTVYGREMGFKFLFAEAVWILTGDNRVETIAPYAKMISEFSDDGYRFQGAYGPKVTEQLRYVCETLLEDPSSRQAVINIWRESPRKSKDIPCTLSLQFLIRDGKIRTVATMRSSDLWLGWVYDVFNFSMITAWVALRIREMGGLHLEMGDLHLNAGSQHLYENNFDSARKCIREQSAWSYGAFNLSDFDGPNALVKHLMYLRDIRSMDKSLYPTSTFLVKELTAHIHA